jgi:hypothetical protein
MPYLLAARPILVPIFALAAGLFCGLINLRLLANAGERLTNSGSARSFVLSSFLRLGAFAIVAVAFAAFQPWWSALVFIASLFLPLALYAIRVARER